MTRTCIAADEACSHAGCPVTYFGTGDDGDEHSFLSNFYVHNGWTVEHFYQAAKATDAQEAYMILAATTPGEAKDLGQAVELRPTWNAERVLVMLALLRIKFLDPELGARLLATGDVQLVEGNWWHDTFWGVCHGNCKHGPHVAHGENTLGRLLMQVRDELRARG